MKEDLEEEEIILIENENNIFINFKKLIIFLKIFQMN